MAKRFAMVGVGGYIAPRHIEAIKNTGNQLVVATDISDSVGILDSFFPQCNFSVHQSDFMASCEAYAPDFLSICTPNDTHKLWIEYGLRHDIDVICEKPLVLSSSEIDEIEALSAATGRCCNVILQLRLHPKIVSLKKQIERSDKIFDVDLTYITSRGKWYFASWKGDETRSGGLAVNIGIHCFDILQWLFGSLQKNVLHVRVKDCLAGFLEFERARVRYFLSINAKDLPLKALQMGERTFRELVVDGVTVEFSEGFTQLHTESYEHILAGDGFTHKDALPSLQIVEDIRRREPAGLIGDYHPYASKK